MDPKKEKEVVTSNDAAKASKTKSFTKKGKGRKGVKEFPKDRPVYKRGPNNPVWRTSDTVMTKLVANLPFGIPAGLAQKVDDININANKTGEFTQPGVMVIQSYVTGGSSQDYNSALNLAIRKIYSFVRHANSGSRNYEAADMGLYFIALGQLLAMLGWLQRTLRLVQEYSATNRYTPKALLQASGCNADDLIVNQAQLKYLVAWLGRLIGGMAFPKMHYFDACYEAFKYVYVDNDSPKEQFYIIQPYNFGVYDPAYSTNGGGVKYFGTNNLAHVYSGTLMTFADIYAIVKERTDVLQGDEDCGIISGDILKAFAQTGLFKPEAFGLDYDVFVKSEEVLEQIHNLSVVNIDKFVFTGYGQQPGLPGNAPYITHDMVVSSGTFGAYYDHLCDKLIIDAFSRDPQPEEVVNATVLNPQIKIKKNTNNDSVYDVATATFDLLLPVAVTNINTISGNTSSFYGYLCRAGYDFNNPPSVMAVLQTTNFDWHPLMAFVTGTNQISFIGDIQNIRIFPYEVGYRIHENSMLSLFNFNDNNFYSK